MGVLRIYTLRLDASNELLREMVRAVAAAAIEAAPDEKERLMLSISYGQLSSAVRRIIDDMDAGLVGLDVELDDDSPPKLVRNLQDRPRNPDNRGATSRQLEQLVQSVSSEVTQATLGKFLEMGVPGVYQSGSTEMFVTTCCPLCGDPHGVEVSEASVLAGVAACNVCGTQVLYRICPHCHDLSLGLDQAYRCSACARKVLYEADPPLHSTINVVQSAVAKLQSVILSQPMECDSEILGHIGRLANLSADLHHVLETLEELKLRLPHRCVQGLMSLAGFGEADDLFRDVLRVGQAEFATWDSAKQHAVATDRVVRLSRSEGALVAILQGVEELRKHHRTHIATAEREALRRETFAEMGLATLEELSGQVRHLSDQAKRKIEQVERDYRTTLLSVLSERYGERLVTQLQGALPGNELIRQMSDGADLCEIGDALYLSDIWLVVKRFWDILNQCFEPSCAKKQIGADLDKLNSLRNALLHHKSCVDDVLLCRVVAVSSDLIGYLRQPPVK